MTARPTITLFSTTIDVLDRQQAISVLMGWLDENRRDGRYVVTPNVDHIVKLSERDDFRAAYAASAMTLVDGKPVLWASRLFGKPLPCTVPGSDIVPALFDACEARTASVFLLGAAPEVAAEAAKNITVKWPHMHVAGVYSPPMGFEHDGAECARIVDMIGAAKPDILVVGLGAPKQELWAHKYAAQLPVNVVLCVGATIDFLAGHKKRAPMWMRRAGLEWLHRMLGEPKRLVKRYAHDAIVFPQLLWREWRKQCKKMPCRI